MSVTTCSICVDKFNKSTRKQIKCPYCDYPQCRQCSGRYILTTPVPKCCSCGNVWSGEFLDDNFTAVFRNGAYRKHHDQVLFDRERALFPQAQILIEEQKERAELKKNIKAIDDEIQNLLRKRIQLKRQYEDARTANPKREFIRPCPASDCRGFLSTSWKCGLCEQYACSNCFEPKGENHECREECVESARIIARETRACPKCGARIYKTEGCPQMWCTQCQTPFDWQTGLIVTGRIHNPHYFEWLRQNSKNGVIRREPGDDPCARQNIDQAIRSWTSRLAPVYRSYFERIHRLIIDVEDYILRRHYIITNTVTANQDLRMMFIKGLCSQDEFMKRVRQREKQNEKNQAIRQILSTFTAASNDLFNVAVYSGSAVNPHEMQQNFEALRSYVNGCMSTTSMRFKCVVPVIRDKYDIFSTHRF